MVEHTSAQMGLHAYRRAAEAYAPQKASRDHSQNDEYHRQAYSVKQKVDIEWYVNTVHRDKAVVDAVYRHTVELGDYQLNVVDYHKRYKTQYQHRHIAHVILIYVFSEEQLLSPLLLFFESDYYYITSERILQ